MLLWWRVSMYAEWAKPVYISDSIRSARAHLSQARWVAPNKTMETSTVWSSPPCPGRKCEARKWSMKHRIVALTELVGRNRADNERIARQGALFWKLNESCAQCNLSTARICKRNGCRLNYWSTSRDNRSPARTILYMLQPKSQNIRFHKTRQPKCRKCDIATWNHRSTAAFCSPTCGPGSAWFCLYRFYFSVRLEIRIKSKFIQNQVWSFFWCLSADVVYF